MRCTVALLTVVAALGCAAGAAAPGDGEDDGTEMARIDGGSYVPLYGDGEPVAVSGFRIDRRLVTNAEYLDFVRAVPRWQRTGTPSLLMGEGYLRHWAGPLEIGSGEGSARPDAPVTHVSWFAARAYCDWRGKRLPTLDEWELVALADESSRDATDDPGFHQRILDWYARPRRGPLPPVGSGLRNVWGVEDQHGLVWEWVEDFNSVFVTGESRADDSLDRQLYCAGAAATASDARNYAAFLRYAMRSSLQAGYAVGNLGFRCAADAP